MRIHSAFIALGFAGSIALAVAASAQQGPEESSTPPPPATSHDSTVTEEPYAQEPAAPSYPTAAQESAPASESRAQRPLESGETAKTTIPLTTDKPMQQQPLVSNTAVIGATVKNAQGEKLGDIRELMIDPQSGRIVYIMLTSSGFLGTGEKSLAIPWEALKVGLGQNELVVEMDNGKLQASDPTYEVSKRQ